MQDNAKAVFDVDAGSFQLEVVERSRRALVMVDFWAEWCAPCRALAPRLEEAARKRSGKLFLAKVNVDSDPELASRFEISSIPAVKIFRDGKVVKEFVGAISPGEIEKIISAAEGGGKADRHREADSRLAGGRWEEASQIYTEILRENPSDSGANLGMGIIAFHQGRWEEAQRRLESVRPETPGYDQVSAMLARIHFELRPKADLNKITSELTREPFNPVALLALARSFARSGEYERALDTLLQLLEKNPAARRGEAKEDFLKLLEILGPGSETGREYSRRLSMLLFS